MPRRYPDFAEKYKNNEIVKCDKCNFDSDEEEKSSTVYYDFYTN